MFCYVPYEPEGGEREKGQKNRTVFLYRVREGGAHWKKLLFQHKEGSDVAI